GMVMSLLSKLINHRLQSPVRDVDTQTCDTEPSGESIVRKMQVIDEEYEALRQKGRRWTSVEVKLAEYRKEMEEHTQVQLKSQMQHFQEVEISRVKMEERQKCAQEVLEIRRQLEKNYEMKSEALMSREKNAIERLQKQQQIEEREMYVQRQTLLKEIQSVQHREAELRINMEAFQRSCKLHEEKMRSSEELLKRRELDVRKLEEAYELKLNSEIRKHQLELEEDYTRRTQALRESENKNKGETERIQREAAIINARREEYDRVVSQLTREQEEMKSAQENMRVLMLQNAELKEKLEGARDYSIIQRKNMELQAEVHLLKRRLEESQEEKQRLRQDLNTPSPELLLLQAELKRLEAARRLDQEDFQNQKQVFQVQLLQEVERSTQLKAQLLECEERTRWMSTHTDELKHQLKQTQQGAASSRWRRSRTDGEEALAEALSRVQELDQEAATLQEAYRNFRRKGVMSHVLLKDTSSPSPHTPAHFFRPIGTQTNRLQNAYPESEPGQSLPGHMTPPTVGSPPIRRLSSTPVSASKTKPRAHTEHVFSGSSSQREVSPIPALSSEEHTHITPPSSPQLKSTTRDNCSPPDLQMISSSSRESSPQPERICIQDLTEPQTGPVSAEKHFQILVPNVVCDFFLSLGVLQSTAGRFHREEEEEWRIKEEEEGRKQENEKKMEEEEERKRIKDKEEKMKRKEEEEKMKREEEERMRMEEEKTKRKEEEERMRMEEE
ncbi:oral-facial-digital syndrome 1 protein-like isoform 1, partial [Silurus asotus]